jgi:hypothetical protein
MLKVTATYLNWAKQRIKYEDALCGNQAQGDSVADFSACFKPSTIA